MRKNSVVVRLAGGLGNQLFQYFAGQYVAHNNATSLVIDVRNLTRSTLENETIETIKSVLERRNSGIRKFDYTQTERSELQPNNLAEAARRLLNKRPN